MERRILLLIQIFASLIAISVCQMQRELCSFIPQCQCTTDSVRCSCPPTTGSELAFPLNIDVEAFTARERNYQPRQVFLQNCNALTFQNILSVGYNLSLVEVSSVSSISVTGWLKTSLNKRIGTLRIRDSILNSIGQHGLLELPDIDHLELVNVTFNFEISLDLFKGSFRVKKITFTNCTVKELVPSDGLYQRKTDEVLFKNTHIDTIGSHAFLLNNISRLVLDSVSIGRWHSMAMLVKNAKSFELINSRIQELMAVSLQLANVSKVTLRNNWVGKLHSCAMYRARLIDEVHINSISIDIFEPLGRIEYPAWLEDSDWFEQSNVTFMCSKKWPCSIKNRNALLRLNQMAPGSGQCSDQRCFACVSNYTEENLTGGAATWHLHYCAIWIAILNIVVALK